MITPLRVLIVEDSKDDALLLVNELRRGGFAPDYQQVDNPDEMTSALLDHEWDLIITDHNMPSFNWETWCPCSAALLYHFTASFISTLTPKPVS